MQFVVVAVGKRGRILFHKNSYTKGGSGRIFKREIGRLRLSTVLVV
jgi:predicted phosphohydrolase